MRGEYFRSRILLGILVPVVLACGPVAPSMEKGNLGLRPKPPAESTDPVVSRPDLPLRVTLYRNESNSSVIIGQDARDWFIKGQSKKQQFTTLSKESKEFVEFRDKRSTCISIDLSKFNNPSAKTLDAAIFFELSLTEKELNPEQLLKFEVKRSFNERKDPDKGAPQPCWLLEIPEKLDQQILKPFLNNLVSISVATSEIDPAKKSDDGEKQPAPTP
jgi:hypothetical protein